MKASVAVAKVAAAKKGVSPTKSDKSIHRVQNEHGMQLGSLRDVIGNIRRDGDTPSVDSIATQMSGMPTGEQAPALLALQRTHGNRYVQRVVSGIQAKLVVGQPGDKYEHEADRVADAVMRMPEPQVQRQEEEEKKKEEEKLIQTKTLSKQITPLVQRQAEEKEEEEEEILQPKEVPGQTPKVTPDFESRIQSLKSSGPPLPEADRSFMERRFGVDFSGVRVHTDSDAVQMSKALNAQAFTYGRDIYFGAGRYSLGTLSGKRLLAHELTHVVQQQADGTVAIQRQEAIAHECREGEGPPAMEPDPEGKGPHPLIYRGVTRERSRRPAVGDAQQLLNRFLEQLKTDEFKCGAGADMEEIQRIRKKLNQDLLEVDCRFGPNTYLATVMFQRCVFPKDPPEWDGKIGPKTWPQLDKLRTTPPPTLGKCPWPPLKPAPKPIPLKYASIDPILLHKLETSYVAHTGGKSGDDFLANSFYGSDPANKCTWPSDLWKALDIAGRILLDMLKRVESRAKLYPYLWNNIELIRNMWVLSSSLGFRFHTTYERSLEVWLKGSPDFCRDDQDMERVFHNGQRCWREVGRVGVEGLHVCLGTGDFPNIHIDLHQIAEGKKSDGSCDIDWLAVIGHAKDVLLPGWDDQLQCVIGKGGCPSYHPGGLPDDDDIRQYNKECRKATGYKGDDIRPDCEKEKSR